jgi:hypothetical protein
VAGAPAPRPAHHAGTAVRRRAGEAPWGFHSATRSVRSRTVRWPRCSARNGSASAPRGGRGSRLPRPRAAPRAAGRARARGINTAVGGTYGDYALATLLAEGGAYCSGILALAYASARVEWDDREAVHHARYGRRPDATTR